VKHSDGRWQNWIPAIGTGFRRSRLTSLETVPTAGCAPCVAPPVSGVDLKRRISSAALAFRGYDVTNAGRSLELLEHPAYGPVVQEVLEEASALCAEAIKAPVDLAAHLRSGAKSSLETFAPDVAMIVAMELAQVTLLERFFDVPVHSSRLCFGYSVGELTAMIHSGVFTMEQLLPIPLGLAPDCAELAADTSLGVLFTRGPTLPPADVQRLCTAVSSEGKGLIGPSAFLSPNTALLLGQGRTLDRVEALMGDFLPEKVMLRRNPNRWPPLHTPLVWQRNIPNRAATRAYQIEGGHSIPDPPVLSCVTGAASYDATNSRDLLTQWTDHPQLLWDVIYETLASGVGLVVHVGPAPNLIPATFARLSNNVSKQLNQTYFHRLGRGVVSSINRHAWLSPLLPSKAALLRAPFLEHVILEDWLLAQPIS
jgi:[acyl-carrier-protein] S-malonyltransferase